MGEVEVHDGRLHVVHGAEMVLDLVLGGEQLLQRQAGVHFHPHD